MEKKSKTNLIVSIIFALIVSATLFFMYDSFKFQTYGGVIYFDYVLSGKNEQFALDNLEVCLTQDEFSINEGKISFQDSSLLNNCPNIRLVLSNETQSFDYDFDLANYNNMTLQYDFDNYQSNNTKILDDITKAQLIIISGDYQTTLDLKIEAMQLLEATNKEYRLENGAISNNIIRLGSLHCVDQNIIKQYPHVSLEYRYLKDEDGDVNDNENYVVFTKVSGLSKDLINQGSYGTFVNDDEDVDLTKKRLSVVVILINDDDRFAFALNLDKQQVGEIDE